jgi:hypothetical protein
MALLYFTLQVFYKRATLTSSTVELTLCTVHNSRSQVHTQFLSQPEDSASLQEAVVKKNKKIVPSLDHDKWTFHSLFLSSFWEGYLGSQGTMAEDTIFMDPHTEAGTMYIRINTHLGDSISEVCVQWTKQH